MSKETQNKQIFIVPFNINNTKTNLGSRNIPEGGVEML